MDETAKRVAKKGTKLNIRRKVSSGHFSDCSILFVSSSERNNLDEILNKVKASPILLIGDTPGYAEKGVGINFYKKGTQIGFKINKKAITKSGLKISSELLKLAIIIDE